MIFTPLILFITVNEWQQMRILLFSLHSTRLSATRTTYPQIVRCCVLEFSITIPAPVLPDFWSFDLSAYTMSSQLSYEIHLLYSTSHFLLSNFKATFTFPILQIGFLGIQLCVSPPFLRLPFFLPTVTLSFPSKTHCDFVPLSQDQSNKS